MKLTEMEYYQAIGEPEESAIISEGIYERIQRSNILLGSTAMNAVNCYNNGKALRFSMIIKIFARIDLMHIVSLSFDDGFKASNEKIAKTYEKFELSACFNVLAENIIGNNPAPDQWQTDESRGDFEQWNSLQKRGHEIMPHGLIHNNLSEVSFGEARQSILECLLLFDEKLDGFHRKEAVFNFPYNDATPALEEWLKTEVRAFRRNGDAINPLPQPGQSLLTTTGSGPENCEWHLEEQLKDLFSRPSGWLIYNTHGVDGEGWGPIRLSYLENLLERLTKMESVRVLPVGQTLNLFDNGQL